MVIISPVIKKLKEDGYHVILNTSSRGLQVYESCPYVDEFIEHIDDSVPLNELIEHWGDMKAEIKPDKFINFTESLEHNTALHPTDPAYYYPKWERKELCDKNYYEEAIRWAGYKASDKLDSIPNLHFTKEEKEEAQGHLKSDKFNILWGMSGSGRNKVYPWTEFVIGDILNAHDNIHFITVGDDKCELIESRDEHITNLSGNIPMRISMCLTKLVDLVISPDTGLLHASGCYQTPKIGLLGHTTIENVTKHFRNDYSLEADCGCAPCFRLVYDINIQCPIEPLTRSAWCMSEGINPTRLYDRIREIIPTSHRRRNPS